MYLIDKKGNAKKFDSIKEFDRLFKTKTRVIDNDGKVLCKSMDKETFKLKFG